MDSIFDTDNLTTLHYNPSTGRENRLWIRYGDDTFEPVRPGGNVNRKYHSRTRPTDWWVTEKPKDWNPADHGFDVSLNHDFGEHDKPGRTGRGAPPRSKLFLRNEDMGKGRQTMEYRYGRDEGKPVLFSDKKASAPAARRTTLAGGGEGYRLAEAERQAAKSSSQAAEDIKGWEREQGIDPNQGSGHERRPPSSSRDAAEMEHRRELESRRNQARRQAKEVAEKGKSSQFDWFKPPLLHPKGTPERDWADSVMQNELREFGEVMLNGGHWSQGLFEWAGDDNATVRDLPRAMGKGFWF